MSDIVKLNFTPPKIDFTKEQLKERIEVLVEELKNDTTLDTNDSLRKEARKVIKHYEEERKTITRQLDGAKKSFMEDVKFGLAPMLELDEELSKEIDKEEQLRKDDKLKEIEALENYDRYVAVFGFDDKWYNKGTSLDNISAAIQNGIDQIEEHEKTISLTAHSHNLKETEYIDMLGQKSVGDIVSQIIRDAELIKQASEPQERENTTPQETNEKRATFNLKLTATKSARERLKVYMSENNIDWEVI